MSGFPDPAEPEPTESRVGAGKWKQQYSDDLQGRQVVIIPVNDKPGREHAEQVAQSLSAVAASVKVVELPGLPAKGGDVSDWLDTGHTADELKAIVQSAPEWEPTEQQAQNEHPAPSDSLSITRPEAQPPALFAAGVP